jgi:hypothetical protein
MKLVAIEGLLREDSGRALRRFRVLMNLARKFSTAGTAPM